MGERLASLANRQELFARRQYEPVISAQSLESTTSVWFGVGVAADDASCGLPVDVLILVKDADGVVDAMELSDLDNLGPLEMLAAELAELLAEEDVIHLAAAMDPGSTAGVLIWENLWAAPFAAAARRSGGQLIADGRIPIQAIIASIEADENIIEEGD